MITTGGYAPGVITLALSLLAVGSKYRLTALCTNIATQHAVIAEAAACPTLTNLDVELFEAKLPEAVEGAPTHGGRGANLCVDAPRRALLSKLSETGDSFVLLDCDMIALQNPDALFSLCRGEGGGAAATAAPALHAVPAFRLKRKSFGSAALGGGFNSGVMVSPAPPSRSDADALAALVAAAGPDDTEESLLNDLFRGRWAELPRGFNVPKRVRAHAPELWNALVAGSEVIFLHFLGAKPWMVDAVARRGADWESERPEYKCLEAAWWAVRRGEPPRHGSLLHLLSETTA